MAAKKKPVAVQEDVTTIPVVQGQSQDDESRYARITRRLARPSPIAALPPKPAGEYRVIHGKVQIALPASSYTRADGTVDEHKPKCETAIPGEFVQLNEADATRLFAANMIEEPNAHPSRLGKVQIFPPVTGKALGEGTPMEYPAPVAG